jgi:hypothetical protein
MGFFNNSMEFLIDRVPRYIGILGLWPVWGVGPNENDPKFLTLRPFKRALICSIMLAGTYYLPLDINGTMLKMSAL